MGAPNILEYLPDSKAAIIYDSTWSPELLLNRLKSIINNSSLIHEYFQWKTKTIEVLSKGFLKLKEFSQLPSHQCRLRKYVIRKRLGNI